MKIFRKRLLGSLIMLVSLSLSWSLAFWLMQLVYHMIGAQPNLWLQQIITSILGMVVIFMIGLFMTRLRRKGHDRRFEFFDSITNALTQIASGDFNVHLQKGEHHEHPDNPFGQIVDHVNDMAKSLGQAENMRQEFISNVSHEIQSPLTSISGFARALRNENLSAETRDHYLSIIETESKRLSKISDNLLKLTYLESDRNVLDLADYRLDKQLQQVVLALEVQWQAKNLQMDLHLDQAEIFADEALMNQVWLNLIGNAIKFTDEFGRILIDLVASDTENIVTITDTGIGISEEEKLHLFERFYKADSARSRHKSGSGLGLSIVKKTLQLHGANIQVDSDQTGTRFRIIFEKKKELDNNEK